MSGWSDRSGASKSAILFVLPLLVLASAAGMLLDSYWIGVLSQALMMGLAAVALDILVGWCGMASLGHAAYFGTAAYVVAIMTTQWDVDPWLAALGGVAAATLLAAVFAPLVVRTRGVAFLMVTIAFNQVIFGIAVKWTDVTGGSDGIAGVSRPGSLLGLSLREPKTFYLLTLIVVGGMYLLLVRLMRGPFGLQLHGVRLSELRLRSLGYDVTRLRIAAFVISGAVVGISGVLFTFFNQFVGANTVEWRFSAQMLLAVVIGGPGSLWGPFVAGVGLFFVQIFATNFTERWILILGVIYILTVLFLPRGIASLVKRGGRVKPSATVSSQQGEESGQSFAEGGAS